MKPEELESFLRKDLGLIGVKRRGNNIHACCPSHKESRPSWGINITEPHIHGCFACGFKGSLRSLLFHLGWSYDRVRNRLGKFVSSSPLSFKGVGEEEVDLPSEDLLLAFSLETPAVRYMRSRGIGYATLKAADVRYHGLDKRVLFPWFIKGRFYGYTGRTIEAKNSVKIEAYGLQKKHAIYLPEGQIHSDDLVLVEGEIDALKVWQAGFKNVAAVGRGNLSDEQVVLLSRSLPVNSRVVLFFDHDERGHGIKARAAPLLLKSFPKVYEVAWDKHYPDAEKVDPGMLPSSEIGNLIRGARRFVHGAWSF